MVGGSDPSAPPSERELRERKLREGERREGKPREGKPLAVDPGAEPLPEEPLAVDPGAALADPLPVILDLDTGIDDALALLYACGSPDIDIIAVTCVAGNVGADQVERNTRAVLELAGRGDISVSPGADRPLVKALETTEETHGPHGIGHAVLPDPGRDLDQLGGAHRIVETARRRPGEVHLITLGPMTNLALALAIEPRLPFLLRGWTFMAGAFRVPGNTTPTSEWNIHVDPDAAKACLAAWGAALAEDPAVPLPVGMGLDVTEGARILPADVARLARRAGAREKDAAVLAAPGSPEAQMLASGSVGQMESAEPAESAHQMRATGSVAANAALRFIVDSLRFYFEFHATYDGFYGAFIHDPFVVAATLDPSLVTTQPVFVDVESGPGLAHGMTVADWRGITGAQPNVAVAVRGDAATFVERLVDRVGGLAAQTA
ncbi:MAG: nucleoside hydrolase [Chloroflexota bacterium]